MFIYVGQVEGLKVGSHVDHLYNSTVLTRGCVIQVIQHKMCIGKLALSREVETFCIVGIPCKRNVCGRNGIQ